MTTFYRVQSVFRDVFDDPTLQLSEELSVANFPDWDSVATVLVVLATELEFGVRFTTEEVVVIRSVADILRLLEAHTTAPSVRDRVPTVGYNAASSAENH